jgi:hypothetical protein
MRPSVACLLCGRPVDRAERRCPAFALAGIPAHAACCGLDHPAIPEPVDQARLLKPAAVVSP